jgi:hypothetical protein
MNFLRFLLLLLVNGAAEAVDYGRRKHIGFRRDIRLLITVVPTLMVLGLLIARAGWDSETMTAGALVTVGRFILLMTGIFASFVMVVSWVRAMEVSYAIVLATQATNALIQRVRPVTKDEADRLLEWLRNATAWLTFLCLLYAILPLYRDLGLCGVFTLIALFAAAVKQAGWFKGTLLRKVAVAFTAVVLLATVATLFSPNLKRLFNSSLGRLDQMSARKSSLLEVEKRAERGAIRADADLMAKFMGEMSVIREYSMKRGCEQFCSEEDRLKYSQLSDQVERLKEGRYWLDDKTKEKKKWKIPFISSEAKAEPKPVTAAPPPPPPWSGSLPNVVKLPPPPASRLPAITYRSASQPKPPAPPPPVSNPQPEPPAATEAPKPVEAPEVKPGPPADDFKELEKYPDL